MMVFMYFSLIDYTFKNIGIFSTPMIVVRTQIKDILKDAGLGVENLSGDFMETLDLEVKTLIVKAAKRAKENGRRTVMGKDI